MLRRHGVRRNPRVRASRIPRISPVMNETLVVPNATNTRILRESYRPGSSPRATNLFRLDTRGASGALHITDAVESLRMIGMLRSVDSIGMGTATTTTGARRIIRKVGQGRLRRNQCGTTLRIVNRDAEHRATIRADNKNLEPSAFVTAKGSGGWGRAK